jgi:hypothetical protein
VEAASAGRNGSVVRRAFPELLANGSSCRLKLEADEMSDHYFLRFAGLAVLIGIVLMIVLLFVSRAIYAFGSSW